MNILNKAMYIAAVWAVFGFMIMVGNDIRQGGDYSRAGLHGIVRMFGSLIESMASVVGHPVVGGAIMVLSLFGAIYAAILIWRDRWFF